MAWDLNYWLLTSFPPLYKNSFESILSFWFQSNIVKIEYPFAYVFVYIVLHVFFHFNFVAFCFYHIYIHSCIMKEYPSIYSRLFLFNILPSCLLYTFFSQLRNHNFTFDWHASHFHHSLCFYSYIFLRIQSEEKCIFQVPDLPQQSTWCI